VHQPWTEPIRKRFFFTQSSAFGIFPVNVTSLTFAGDVPTVFGGSNLDLSAAGIAEESTTPIMESSRFELVLPKDVQHGIRKLVFGELLILGAQGGGIFPEIQHTSRKLPTRVNRSRSHHTHLPHIRWNS